MPDKTEIKTPQADALRSEQISTLHYRADIDASTINLDDRTVEVVFATDSPVRMWSWEDGHIHEILSFTSGHVRWERINAGAPLLDNHNRWEGTKGVLGVVEKAWSPDGKTGRAKIRFSKRDDVNGTWQDVKDGILKGVSVGYDVYAYIREIREGELPLYTAIDWEPKEISLAPIPADYNASIRAEAGQDQKHEVKISGLTRADNSNKNSNKMPDTPESGAAPKPVAPESKRTENPNPAPAAPANTDAERAAATAAERTRSTEILKACRQAGFDVKYAEELIASDKSLDQCRAAIIEKWGENDPNKGQRSEVTVTAEETEKKRAAMEASILLRSNPATKVSDAEREGAKDFRGMSLLDLARECAELAGAKTRGMTPREIANIALNLNRAAGMHSTSDFPIILGNTINRVLLAEYALQQRTFLPWTRQNNSRDFREKTVVRLGEVAVMKEVKEGGEYQYATLGEGKESYKVAKYGHIIAVTWEAIVNDDLGAFNRLPAKIASAAARLQSDIVYAILTGSHKMSDGKELFHADHKNVAGAGTDLTIDALTAARLAMRTQKGIDGKDFLNIFPSFLIVGPELETKAYQILNAETNPTEIGKANPFKGSLSTVIEPRITDKSFRLAAAPGAVDTIEYSFLEGEGELFTETRYGFNVDGVETKARMVFGAKAIDWRGLYKNAGL